jgi:uncharacterized protein (DUF983 family)
MSFKTECGHGKLFAHMVMKGVCMTVGLDYKFTQATTNDV